MERHDLCPADYPRSGAGEKPSDLNRGRSTPLPSAASTSQPPPNHKSVAPQSQYTMYFSKATTFAWGSFMQLFGGQTYSFSDYSQALQTGPLKLT